MIRTAVVKPSLAPSIKASYKFTPVSYTHLDACTLIRKEQMRNQQRIRRLQSRLKELNYYLRIHNVHDEGYNTVAGYTDEIKNRTAQAKALSSILDSIQKSKQIRIFHKTSYTAHYNNRKGERQHVYMVEINASAKQQTVLLQTTTQTHLRVQFLYLSCRGRQKATEMHWL